MTQLHEILCKRFGFKMTQVIVILKPNHSYILPIYIHIYLEVKRKFSFDIIIKIKKIIYINGMFNLLLI